MVTGFAYIRETPDRQPFGIRPAAGTHGPGAETLHPRAEGMLRELKRESKAFFPTPSLPREGRIGKSLSFVHTPVNFLDMR